MIEVALLDVDGIPVSIGDAGDVPFCAAWDVFPPRAIRIEYARSEGAPVKLGEFVELILKHQSQAGPA